MRNTDIVVLGLGSNRPYGALNPHELVLSAARDLGGLLGGMRLSPLYRTAPQQVKDQAAFINAACRGFWDGTPEALLEAAGMIEARYGRNRGAERRWGERSMDIDILLFGGRVINTPLLQIPHPRLAERRFALQPLLDLLPRASDPESGVPYRSMLDAVSGQHIERV
ncbi:MAG: 2-amino-4-hydroxy-6-hydroxymethyldihydropteridine diphosphokinase [Treponema sp.]|jgi:2-amino-4-hydroxy-6-hydroxymethyldihydropteridine diphosphokinase|nr:2-amino-4-hydroxy-6-hydroxymethyldihydropteridine diphosphokinase [Treponema sp.]